MEICPDSKRVGGESRTKIDRKEKRRTFGSKIFRIRYQFKRIKDRRVTWSPV